MFSCKFYEIFKNNSPLEVIGFWIFQPNSMSRYYNKNIKLTSVAAIFFNILPTLWMLFVCLDKFGSHHPEQVLKISNMFKKISLVKFRCRFHCLNSIVIAVHIISLTSLLSSVCAVGSVGTQVCGWRESNFGRGRVSCAGLQSFGTGQK